VVVSLPEPVLVSLVVFVSVEPVPRPVEPPPAGVVFVAVLELELLLEPLVSPELVPEVELDPEPAVVSAVLVVLTFVAVDGDAVPVVGTVSCGAPFVLPAFVPPPPHAARATATRTAAAAASSLRELVGNWIHPLPAPGAVEQILLRELVTAPTETEVLDRPGEL
jgi:hypothetical protein